MVEAYPSRARRIGNLVRSLLPIAFVGCGRLGFVERSAIDGGANQDTIGSQDTIGQQGDGGGGVCGEAVCQPVVGSYISHFTLADCTGTESYYTPYFSDTAMPNPDGKIYSWDGNGVAGTTYRTVTNTSYKDQTGTCVNAWPDGNTLPYFVTIYR